MTTTRETLIAARALVAKGWCQGVAARDETGKAVPPKDWRARCFCMDGAIFEASKSNHSNYLHATEAIGAIVGTSEFDLIDWNDHPDRTQAEVVEAFDRAIEGCA